MMRVSLVVVLLVFTCLTADKALAQPSIKSTDLKRLEMHFVSRGLVVDTDLTIDVTINFFDKVTNKVKIKDESLRLDTAYSPTDAEIKSIEKILSSNSFKKLNHNYTSYKTDLPISTAHFISNKKTFKVVDYGMIAKQPLKSIYKIVYKYYFRKVP